MALGTMEGAIRSVSDNVCAVSVSLSDLTSRTILNLQHVANNAGVHIVWVTAQHVRLNPPDGYIEEVFGGRALR